MMYIDQLDSPYIQMLQITKTYLLHMEDMNLLMTLLLLINMFLLDNFDMLLKQSPQLLLNTFLFHI